MLKWLKQLFCTHEWFESIIPFNPNKYPSKHKRKCKKCKKVQYKSLDGRLWING